MVPPSTYLNNPYAHLCLHPTLGSVLPSRNNRPARGVRERRLEGRGRQATPSQAQKEQKSTSSPHGRGGIAVVLPNGRFAVQKRGEYMSKTKNETLLLGTCVLVFGLF